MLNEILQKFGLQYEDLNGAERGTLNSWMTALQQNELTVNTIKLYIGAMRDAVEAEITTTENNSKKDLLLKARLRNYMLLEAFLSTPEKAKKALERAVAGIVSTKA
jgi:hypothetical protein